MAIASDAEKLVATNSSHERKIRRRWDGVIAWLRQTWTVAKLEPLVASRDFSPLEASLTRAAEAFASSVEDAYWASGEVGADTVRRALGFTFAKKEGDQPFVLETNQRAIEFLRRERLRLVREVVDEQRAVWTEIIGAGMRRGDNPRVIAKEIRASLGLTARQQRAVDNFRSMLQRQSADALTRELRDRRYDVKLENAIAGRKALTSAEIDTMTERYRQRYINYRAEVVARTEALRAVHEGVDEAYRQAIDGGDLQSQDVERTWVVAGGVNRKGKARTRDSHRAMRGQKRQLGQPFRSGYGYALRYPGDIDAPASETVQCRCAVTTRIRRSAAPAVPVPVEQPPATLPSVTPKPVKPPKPVTVKPPRAPKPKAPKAPDVPVMPAPSWVGQFARGDYAAMRADLASDLAKRYGVTQQKLSHNHAYEIADSVDMAAHSTNTGKVTVNPNVHKSALRLASSNADDWQRATHQMARGTYNGDPPFDVEFKDFDNLSHLVHEEIHGFGNVSGRAYKGVGAYADEMMTETLARRYMIEAVNMPRSLAWRVDRGGGLMPVMSGYNRQLNEILDRISAVTGSIDQAANELMDAAVRFKQNTRLMDDSYDVGLLFVESFSPHVRDAVREIIRTYGK